MYIADSITVLVHQTQRELHRPAYVTWSQRCVDLHHLPCKRPPRATRERPDALQAPGPRASNYRLGAEHAPAIAVLILRPEHQELRDVGVA